MREKWKDIDGFPGYQVSNLGDVRSFKNGAYGLTKKPHLLVPGRDLHQRAFVILGPERKCLQVHKLVAEAFIPNPNNYPIVRHLDDDPYNNKANNLAWGTYSMNMADVERNGHLYHFSAEDLEKSAQMHRKPVIAYTPDTNEALYFRSARETDDYIGSAHGTTANAIRCGYKNKGYQVNYIGEEVDMDEIQWTV